MNIYTLLKVFTLTVLQKGYWGLRESLGRRRKITDRRRSNRPKHQSEVVNDTL